MCSDEQKGFQTCYVMLEGNMYLLYCWDRLVHSEEDTIGQDCQNDEQIEILIY